MKKLLTILNLFTVTSSIMPLTVACKKSVNSSNRGSTQNSSEKTDEDKIKDAKTTLTKFENIDINNANVDQLKDLIKSKIEHGLNKEDGVTIESAMKITRKNETADLKNSDITTNENDITITGQFKSGSLTEPFTLNTKVKLIGTKTDEDKIKDAKNTLTKFENIDINNANVDQLKDLIKSKIEHGLNKKDGVTVENAMKITRKNETADLKNSDITINENDITITGQFKSGSLTESFTLNTKVKLIVTRGIDINEITADMIINWKINYNYGQIDVRVVKAEKLGSIVNPYIKSIIKKNLTELLQHKLAGIDKTKLDDIEKERFRKLSDKESEQYAMFYFFSLLSLIKCDVKYDETKPDSKIFTVNIEKLDWDAANKDDELKNIISEYQNEVQEYLNVSFEDKRDNISDSNMSEEEIQQEIDSRDKIYNNVLQQVNINSIKSMYDLIIGTNKTIVIDLTHKQ